MSHISNSIEGNLWKTNTCKEDRTGHASKYILLCAKESLERKWI